MRPFVLGAKVHPRGCSRPLQRAIVDFAADEPFAQVQLKLREHYGFEIGESTIQRIALGHAQAIFASGRDAVDFPEAPGRHKQIVAQTDGGMIPVMTPDASQKDKRKGKKLSWREAKISLAHAKGSRTPVYGGGIEGGVEAAGRRLFACAVRAGFGADSRVHAVGDGAPWIIGQIEELFGEQGSYLIDFYHVCEYLSAAAKTIAPDAAAGKAWMEAQKDALKTGRADAVLSALAAPPRSSRCERRPSAGPPVPSVSRRPQRPIEISRGPRRRASDRLRRNRKRASLCRAKAPEAARRLVAASSTRNTCSRCGSTG